MKKIAVALVIIAISGVAMAEDFSYSFNYGHNRSGNTSLSKGQSYTIHDAPGGCGGNDTARCHYNDDGTLSAYYKDSCTTGDYGPRVSSGCSSASVKSYTVNCCFANQTVTYRFNYGSNRNGSVLLKKGQTYTIHDAPGGCGGNDTARCHYNDNGTLSAYYKDSCTVGDYGPSVSSGCSNVSAKGYEVSCCL